MTKDSIRLVKNVCWLLFVGICVVHFWLDGRKGAMMMELKRQGQTLAGTGEQVQSFCGPLNVATVVVLGLIGVLSFMSSRASSPHLETGDAPVDRAKEKT